MTDRLPLWTRDRVMRTFIKVAQPDGTIGVDEILLVINGIIKEYEDHLETRDLIRVSQERRNNSPQFHSLPASEMVELRNSAIKYFYYRVCRQAEKNMAATGTVSGAHWNAMRQVLAQMRIEVDDTPKEGDK